MLNWWTSMKNNLHNLKEFPSCKSLISEKQPLTSPTHCTIWGVNIYKYFSHPNTSVHKKFMKKRQKEYNQIDELWEKLNQESLKNIKRPLFKKISKINPLTKKIKSERKGIKRKTKRKKKEEELITQYVQDRLVVMQIETQSQPFSKYPDQHSNMMDHSNSKYK